MDTQWITNLAQATWNGQNWTLEDPDQVKNWTTACLVNFMPELFEAITEATALYNQYASDKRKINILPCREEADQIGFMLTVGKQQLKVVQSDQTIKIIVQTSKNSSYHAIIIHQFHPELDPFGGISWIMNGKSAMTMEFMIKHILTECCFIDQMQNQ